MDRAPLLDIAFTGDVVEWRGPSPHFFVAVPATCVPDVRHAARLASYGWGVVPVEAMIGDVGFRTSLFPREETYLLPLRADVRKGTGIAVGDRVTVTMKIYPGG